MVAVDTDPSAIARLGRRRAGARAAEEESRVLRSMLRLVDARGAMVKAGEKAEAVTKRVAKRTSFILIERAEILAK